LLVLISGCTAQENAIADNKPQIANPASVYCEEQGGILRIEENEAGQYGICVLDGIECEEWEFYRGECGR